MKLAPIHSLGLSSRESAIYLACLEHGPLHVSDIARYTKLKRTTVAYTLPSLLTQGVLSIVRRSRRTLYDARAPKHLLTSLRQRERELQEALPELERLRAQHDPAPHVEVYEGDEAVRRVYDELYASIDRRYELCCVTRLEDLLKFAPYAVDNYYAIVKNKKSLRIREIMIQDSALSQYKKARREMRIQTESRVLPDTYPIHNDCVLHRDRVYLFSFGARSYVTILHDAKVYQTMRGFFEWMWVQGEEME